MFDWAARGAGESGADHALRLLIAAMVLAFPAMCLLIDRSDSLSLLILLVVGLSVWVRSGFKAGLNHREWLYVSVFALFFFAGVAAFEFGHQTDSGFRLMGRYLRLLLALPALIALKRYRPPALLVWAGLGFGALCLGGDAVWERYVGNRFVRPDGDTNVAILFGDLATLTTFVFAAGYVYIDERLPRLGPWLVALCVLAGLLACFLSGTRGAWFAAPVLLILLISCRHLLPTRIVLVAAIVAAGLFAALFFLPQTHVRERLKSMASQLELYREVMDSFERMGAPPLCIDDPVLLQAWAVREQAQSGQALKVDVVSVDGQDKRSLVDHGCSRFFALHLRNSGSHAAFFVMPRAQRPGPGPVTTRWLVSGRGALKFGHGRAALHPFQQRLFYTLDMTTTRKYGDWVVVLVAPQSEVRVVPVEGFVGEYRYSLINTSIGQRLQMWSAAWRMFLQAPLTGVGTGAYMTVAQQMVDAGTEPVVTAVYDHPHSDYLDALSSRGLLGVLAVLGLLGVPAWLFGSRLDSPDPARMGAALGGLLVASGFALFGITETMLIHSVTLGWYVIMTAVFMSLVEAPLGQESVSG